MERGHVLAEADEDTLKIREIPTQLPSLNVVMPIAVRFGTRIDSAKRQRSITWSFQLNPENAASTFLLFRELSFTSTRTTSNAPNTVCATTLTRLRRGSVSTNGWRLLHLGIVLRPVQFGLVPVSGAPELGLVP